MRSGVSRTLLRLGSSRFYSTLSCPQLLTFLPRSHFSTSQTVLEQFPVLPCSVSRSYHSSTFSLDEPNHPDDFQSIEGPENILENGYPAPVDPYLNDFASFLNPDVEYSLRKTLRDIHRNCGFGVSLVILQTMEDYEPGASRPFDQFGDELLNSWQSCQPESDTGVLFLVGLSDCRLHIAIDDAFPNYYRNRLVNLGHNYINPELAKFDFMNAIVVGVQGVEWCFTEEITPAEKRENFLARSGRVLKLLAIFVAIAVYIVKAFMKNQEDRESG